MSTNQRWKKYVAFCELVFFLSVPKVTERKKTKKSVSSSFFSLIFSYFWINSPLAGTEFAQADPVSALPPLNTVHCRLYTCAGQTRDEYFQLLTTRDENFHQPWLPMLPAQKAVWRSALVFYCKTKTFLFCELSCWRTFYFPITPF